MRDSHRYKTIKPGEASINPDNLPQLANDYGQRYTASTTYSSNIRPDEIYSFDSSSISSSKELSNPHGNWKNSKEKRYGESIRYIWKRDIRGGLKRRTGRPVKIFQSWIRDTREEISKETVVVKTTDEVS